MPKQTINVAKKGAVYAPFYNTILFSFIIIDYFI